MVRLLLIQVVAKRKLRGLGNLLLIEQIHFGSGLALEGRSPPAQENEFIQEIRQLQSQLRKWDRTGFRGRQEER